MHILSRIIHTLSLLRRPKPSRDWLLALGSFFVVSFFVISYAVSVYFSVSSGNAFAGGEPAPAPAISLTRTDIQAIADAYRIRALNYQLRNLPAPTVVDPAK